MSGVDDLRFDPPPECSTCDGLGVVPATGRGSDGWDPCPTCPHCNDEGVVCTHDGDIIGPCDCTSDELAAEARRLLDAATPGPWQTDADDPDGEHAAVWTDAPSENVPGVWANVAEVERPNDAELIAAAPRLIAALLAERDADVSAGAVARTVAMSHIAAERDAERAARERAEADRDEAERRERTAVNLANYHRDVARTAGGRAEHAEAEARQLREAIREHKDRHNSWRQQTQRPSDIALWAALNAAAVAEGGEDAEDTE